MSLGIFYTISCYQTALTHIYSLSPQSFITVTSEEAPPTEVKRSEKH